MKTSRKNLRDGAYELAVAVASLSELVVVTGTGRRFQTLPADLFDRRFEEAGIGDGQMPFLRAQLARALGEIVEDLEDNARLLDNARHRIGDYAEFLRVALAMRGRA